MGSIYFDLVARNPAYNYSAYIVGKLNAATPPKAAPLVTPSAPAPNNAPSVDLESQMSIVLNHTIVPARDKEASAQWFAQLFGLELGGAHGPFSAVKVNPSLTLLFDRQKSFEPGHYAFHVGDAEFDAIFGRVKAAGLAFGSSPGHFEDGEINHWNGGRGVYFRSPDGHILELMTVPQ